MGFFGDLWSGIKNVAGNIWNGVSSATNWVADKVQPIVKAVGDYAGYIPVIGAPIAGVAQQINKGIDVAKNIVGQVGKYGGAIGGAIDRLMPQSNKTFSRPM
jgi:hypothetical protein